MEPSRPSFNYQSDLFMSFPLVLERQKNQSELSGFALELYSQLSKTNGAYVKALEKNIKSLAEPTYKDEHIFPYNEVVAVLKALSNAANQFQSKLANDIVPALAELSKNSAAEIAHTGKEYALAQTKTNNARGNQVKAENKSRTAWEASHAADANSNAIPEPKVIAAATKAKAAAEKFDADLHSAVEAANVAELNFDETIKSGLNRLEDLEWSRLEKLRTTCSDFASVITGYASALSGAADNLSFISSGLAPENVMESFRAENARGFQSNKITNYVSQNSEVAPASVNPVADNTYEPINREQEVYPQQEQVQEDPVYKQEPQVEAYEQQGVSNVATEEEF